MTTLEAMAEATIAQGRRRRSARIYGDDLTYAHSVGVHAKTKATGAGEHPGAERRPGTFMKFSDTTIRIYGDVALAKGVVDFRSAATGQACSTTT